MDLTNSYEMHVPDDVLLRYEFVEVRNAAAVLKASDPALFDEVVEVLDDFYVQAADITVPGGNRGTIAIKLDRAFEDRSWVPVRINTWYNLVGKIKGTTSVVFDSSVHNDGFEVDNMKGRVALDVEWNAKDGNLDRDLSAYRALYDVGLIDCAVIITRDYASILQLAEIDLQDMDAVRRLKSTTTTNIQKLRPRLSRGDAGGCPVLGVAITRDTWDGM